MRTFEHRGFTRHIAPMLVLAAVVAACSGSSATLSSVGGAIDEAGNRAAAGMPTAGPAALAPDAAASAAPSAASGNGSAATTQDNLRIVYTGSLDLVVADMQPALAKAKAAVMAAGGYIGASEEVNKGDQPVATITYRIPASHWEDTIGSLRGLATKVVLEQTQATEVGGQLVDLEARLTNLRASEAALQDIARNTAKVSDLLEVQSQLTDVRGQIEELDAQRAHLVDQVAYGTLTTTYGLEVAAVKEAAQSWNPTKDVDNASATLINAGQTIVSVAIWFAIVGLPLLILLGLLLFVVRLLWRRFGPKPRGPQPPIEGWNPG